MSRYRRAFEDSLVTRWRDNALMRTVSRKPCTSSPPSGVAIKTLNVLVIFCALSFALTGCTERTIPTYSYLPRYQSFSSDVIDYSIDFGLGDSSSAIDPPAKTPTTRYSPALTVYRLKPECTALVRSLKIFSHNQLEAELNAQDLILGSGFSEDTAKLERRSPPERWRFRTMALTNSDKLVRVEITSSCSSEPILAEFHFQYSEEHQKVGFFRFLSFQ